MKKEIAKTAKKGIGSNDGKSDIVVFRREVSPIVELATSVVIKDEKTMHGASEILSRLNGFNDRVVEHRERKTVPLNQALKEIRSDYKPIEEALKLGISHIRGEMGAYQTRQKRLEDEEAAKIASRVGSGSGRIKMDTAVRKIDGIERVSDRVATDSGTVKFRTDRRLKVMDETMIPRAYLLADERRILEALKAGRLVSGCVIEEVQVPINFR